VNQRKQQKMTFKAILSGRLEFGNTRSCEKAIQLFQNRFDIIYRSDIFLKADDIFNLEEASLDLYRFSGQVADKTWHNTMAVLEEVSRFAIAGKLHAWLTDNGKVLYSNTIEPHTEKTAVQAFIQGRELIQQQGHEAEAIQAFNQAIEKYERHALAYERRGFVNYRLHNLNDALYDYNKSISLNPGGAEAYLGRACVNIAQQQYAEAITDLEKAINFSVPLMPIYWIARRMKGDCHLENGAYEEAVKEYQLFLKRAYASHDDNFNRRRRASFRLGKALMALQRYKEAIQAFEQALQYEGEDNAATEADIQSWLQEGRLRLSAPSKNNAVLV
jgi:tetratricopeptide (TPR) repeat protein